MYTPLNDHDTWWVIFVKYSGLGYLSSRNKKSKWGKRFVIKRIKIEDPKGLAEY